MAVKAYKYRIYPNKGQQQKILMFCGCARKVYNLLIGWWRDSYKKYKEDGEAFGKTPDYTSFKSMPEYSYMKQCDAVALQQARKHFENAITNFLKDKKKGFPQFKRKGVSKYAYTTFNNNGGNIRISVIKSVNVSMTKSGNFYVSLTVETGEKDKPLFNRELRASNPNVVGLDMSMSSFVVSSDESDMSKTKYVRLQRKNAKKLRKLQKEISRKKIVGTGEYIINRKGREVEIKELSKNREKARKKYAKVAEHVANQRRDFLVKTALYFVRKYDVIVLEDIDMAAMAKGLNLGKSVYDLGFGEFRKWLEHEGRKYDCYIHYVDKWFASSKLCNSCGYKNGELRLSDREWVCPECGERHDRDVNAARNLRDEFLRQYNTAGTAGIQACGDGTSTLRETVARVLSASLDWDYIVGFAPCHHISAAVSRNCCHICVSTADTAYCKRCICCVCPGMNSDMLKIPCA